MMNKNERITYTELAIQVELERIGKVFFYTEEQWNETFLVTPGVDPLNVHKQYGMVVPQFSKDRWLMGVSAAHLIKPLEGYNDQDLNTWIEYWLVHTILHVVIRQSPDYGEMSSLEEVELRVDTEMEAQGRDLYNFGEQIKLLTAQKAAGQ